MGQALLENRGIFCDTAGIGWLQQDQRPEKTSVFRLGATQRARPPGRPRTSMHCALWNPGGRPQDAPSAAEKN